MKLLFLRNQLAYVKFFVSSASSYPRPEWFRKYLKRVEGLQKDLDASIDELELKKAQIEVLENQERCGVDILTEGLLIWHDFLATIPLRMGFKPDGLARYFENNLYYRIPVLEDERMLKKPVLEDFRIACKIWKRKLPLKAIISCLTAFYLSKCNEKIFPKFAELVMQEVQDLFKLTDDVQLDEPILSFNFTDQFEAFIEVVDSFDFKRRLWISTYFGDLNREIYSKLIDRFDVVGLDFVEGLEGNLDNLRELGCKSICAGIVDGRNTKMENPDLLRQKVEKIADCGPNTVYLSTNTGLEFLPEFKAYEKMTLLSKLKKVLK
jgi:5-methyltetrahydropteroyltriglutamate--homocysteine methyltransferase